MSLKTITTRYEQRKELKTKAEILFKQMPTSDINWKVFGCTHTPEGETSLKDQLKHAINVLQKTDDTGEFILAQRNYNRIYEWLRGRGNGLLSVMEVNLKRQEKRKMELQKDNFKNQLTALERAQTLYQEQLEDVQRQMRTLKKQMKELEKQE